MDQSSPILRLPQELRDEIYSHIILPAHVYTSSSKPNTYSLHRSTKASETYLDSRISLPAIAPTNVLGTCKQLRQECLDFVSHLYDASHTPTQTAHETEENPESNQIAARANTDMEELIERSRDDGTVRITIEILKQLRGEMGYYIPVRKELSPRFMAWLPRLNRLKKIKFIVWAGWDWWQGPPKAPRTRLAKFRVKRTTADQTDEVQSTSGEEIIAQQPLDNRPDPLYVTVGSFLEHLPLVEEVQIEVLMNVGEYMNWDLPDAKWEMVKPYLDGSAFPQEGRRLKKVYRRLVCVSGAAPKKGCTFYHKMESWGVREGNGTAVHVAEGDFELSEHWVIASEAVPFIRTYKRVEPL